MTTDPTNAGAPGLIERAKNILLTPQAEWDRIAGEPADVGKLYTGYVLPLAALAAIAGFIGTSVIGASAFGVSYRVPMVTGVVMGVVQIIAVLIGVFVMAMVTNALAPSFGSQQDQGQAHKLAVYGATAALLGGLFAIIPAIAVLGLLAAIYSLVLIWIGLPRMMKTPEDKRVGYFATIIVICIVVGFVINMVLGSMALMTGGLGGLASGFGGGAAQQQQSARVEGQVTLPGGGTVDLGELQRQAEAMSGGGGGAAAVDPMRLQAQLPQTLPGGFALTSASSGSMMGTAQAEGVYQRGDAQLTVTVVHMGAMGALAGMAQGMNVQENRQDADGYARTQTIDGRIYNEEVSTSGGSASYGVIGRGIAVTADGYGGVTLDQARAAVETIGVQRLEREFGG
jgi:hypothetical protein